MLGPWANPSDKTPHQGRTWEQVYHEILSGLRAKGLSIYALIGSEAVQVDPGNLLRDAPEDTAPDIAARARSWVEQYVANFCAIARQFREQVQVFESFNEPDDWHGGGRAWVHPAWFAIMLQAIHQAARAAPDLRDLTLVSGPLQGLEINRNEAPKAYLRDTYAQGKRRFGWGQTVPFPFDGVGYHLYIKEGWEADWPKQEQAVRATYRAYVDGIRAVIREAEGRDKPLYLSEFGWLSNRGLEDFQAENLRVGLNLALEDPAVDLAIWFCTQDFGEEHDNKYYGLYRKGNLTPDNRKPAYYAFKALCQSALPIGTAPFTNQTMINAVFAAAKELGVPPWNLLVKAGLSDLVAWIMSHEVVEKCRLDRMVIVCFNLRLRHTRKGAHDDRAEYGPSG
ncbi:MAG: hypothetical protein FJZ90_19290, partial [Chloroflexi bacterium]|nr:hypothetical protein [Chloroflexota bacterium]